MVKRWLAGREVSIADVATFGWIWRRGFADVDFGEHVKPWFNIKSTPTGAARTEALLNA